MKESKWEKNVEGHVFICVIEKRSGAQNKEWERDERMRRDKTTKRGMKTDGTPSVRKQKARVTHI